MRIVALIAEREVIERISDTFAGLDIPVRLRHSLTYESASSDRFGGRVPAPPEKRFLINGSALTLVREPSTSLRVGLTSDQLNSLSTNGATGID